MYTARRRLARLRLVVIALSGAVPSLASCNQIGLLSAVLARRSHTCSFLCFFFPPPLDDARDKGRDVGNSKGASSTAHGSTKSMSSITLNELNCGGAGGFGAAGFG